MTERVRDRVLAALDAPAFYREVEGLELIEAGRGQFSALCPFHDDNGPSLNIRAKDGVFNCFAAACGVKGSVFDFHIKKNNLPGSPGEQFKAALRTVAEFAGVTLPGVGDAAPLPEADVPKWHTNLMQTKPRLKWLHDKRGLTDATIALFQLGWDGERYTIPVRDEEGSLINVRRYLPNAPTIKGKMLGIPGHNERRLFYPKAEQGDEIVLTEGELDCILARQEGINADTVTSGAGNWADSFTPRFKGKRVILCYDNDDTGRRGTQVIGRHLLTVTDQVYAIAWPSGFKAKGDVTDYLIEAANSTEDLVRLIKEAPKFVPIKDEKDWGFKYPLTDLGNAERLVARFGDVLRYVDPWNRWLTWNGRPVWQQDESRDVINRAIETVRLMKSEAEELDDDKLVSKLKAFALQSEGERKIAAMVSLSKAKLAIAPDDLNRDPWLVNLPNGVLHLKRLV